jgi:hypothetical protein
LRGECLLQVLFGTDLVALWILELEGEVSNHPIEGWEVHGNLIRIDSLIILVLGLELDVFGQVHH